LFLITLSSLLPSPPHLTHTQVDILNDLLTFEKIQAGIMEIHKGDVNIMSFVHSCCGIFNSQVRAIA
jgi:signal transduction histidine kinase